MPMSPLLTRESLAALLGISVSGLAKRRPCDLPPPVRQPGGRRLLWRAEDVSAWLEQHRAAPAEDSPPRRRGRRRKGGAAA